MIILLLKNSMTYWWNSMTFPRPQSFSMTFHAWKIPFQIARLFMTFHDVWKPRESQYISCIFGAEVYYAKYIHSAGTMNKIRSHYSYKFKNTFKHLHVNSWSIFIYLKNLWTEKKIICALITTLVTAACKMTTNFWQRQSIVVSSNMLQK